MSSFKEIVTKAVIGKAKKTNNANFLLTPEEKPNTILGCWVINHSFNGLKGQNGQVVVNGSFDVNVWYSFDDDKKTAVTTKNFSYSDKMNVPLRNDGNMNNASEIIVRCLKQPTVSNVFIENDQVKLDIEKEMGVEIVGDAKVKVSVEDDYDDYEEIVDDEVDNVDDVIDNIDDNYLNNN